MSSRRLTMARLDSAQHVLACHAKPPRFDVMPVLLVDHASNVTVSTRASTWSRLGNDKRRRHFRRRV